MTDFKEKLSIAIQEDEDKRLHDAKNEFARAFEKVFGFFPKTDAHEKRDKRDLFTVAGNRMICENGRIFMHGRRIGRPSDMVNAYTVEFYRE